MSGKAATTGKASASTASISLAEAFGSAGPSIKPNRESGIVPGVKIVGFESRNKRRYPESTLRRAIPMYEGKTVYIDHPANGSAERSYRDNFGVIQNVRMGEGGLVGDLKYKTKHPLAESVLEDVENDTKGIGLSPNHFGGGPVKDGIRIVENISRVDSVDIVDNPATNRSFRESEDRDVELQEQLTEATSKVAELTRENAKLSGEVVTLKESVAGFEADKKKNDHKTAVTKLLDDAKIPDVSRTKYVVSFLESLTIENATAEVKLLAEQAGKPRSVSGTPKPLAEGTKGSGGQGTSTVTDGKSFAASIRG